MTRMDHEYVRDVLTLETIYRPWGVFPSVLGRRGWVTVHVDAGDVRRLATAETRLALFAELVASGLLRLLRWRPKVTCNEYAVAIEGCSLLLPDTVRESLLCWVGPFECRVPLPDLDYTPWEGWRLFGWDDLRGTLDTPAEG